jgi:hypothetical protein
MVGPSPYSDSDESHLPPFVQYPYDAPGLSPAAIADFHRVQNPDHTFVLLVPPDATEDQVERVKAVTWKSYGEACSRAGRYLSEQLGAAGLEKKGVVGVLSNAPYLVSLATVVGAIHADYTPFAVSERNSLDGLESIAKASDMHHLIVVDSPALRRTGSRSFPSCRTKSC